MYKILKDTMKVTHRLATAQYCYVEMEQEYATPEEAMAEHKRLEKLYSEEGELTHREWVAIRNNMLVTGECDPNEMHRFSPSQRWFCNELKLALRSHSAEEPVIN